MEAASRKTFVYAFLLAALFPPPAGAERLQLAVDGRTRSFIVERPPGAGPWPAIIALHGFGGTGEQIARRTGLDRLAPRAGFVAVFPDGLRNRWKSLRPGTDPPQVIEDWRASGGPPDDVSFVSAIIGDLIRRGVADPKRVHLLGSSNGSFMALRLICDESGRFASVALLVSGMPEALGADCRPAQAIPVLMINGTADVVVPYAGGPVQPGGLVKTWPAERLAEFLRRNNGCTGSGQDFTLPERAGHKSHITRWTDCSGAPFTFHRVLGAGHDAPWTLDIGPLLMDFFRAFTPGYGAAQPPAGPINLVRYRRMDGTLQVTGEVRRTGAGNWVETNTRGSRWTFRVIAENPAAIVLQDVSRDIYLKIDLMAQKLWVAKGTQPWAFLAEIAAAER